MTKIQFICLTLAYCLSACAQKPQKPKVWIYTDMSDRNIPGNNHMNTVNDPDDISAMAGYLLMANMFDTKGIVITSTHRKAHRQTPRQDLWAHSYFGEAYKKDVVELNKNIGGYPKEINFMESSIKSSGEHFQPDSYYASLASYKTVEALKKCVQKEDGLINVLCWGSLTEPAILVKHCLEKGEENILGKLRFIAHWTNSTLHQGSSEHPENVANCREDASACAYLKKQAELGHIQYHECGAIGQHGIVSGSPKGDVFFDQFTSSNLGKIFVEGKYVRGRVDHSDAATYWTLLGNWGVSVQDIPADGTNEPSVEIRNEERFKSWSPKIHQELLRRSKAAVPSK